ncbi:MAG: DUF6537 domain-containing protein [Streptosporangiaceae bacterium]
MAQQTLRTSGLLPGTVIRDRYVLGDGAVPMTGVQALVRLVFDLRRADQRAGRRTAGFISGYEAGRQRPAAPAPDPAVQDVIGLVGAAPGSGLERLAADRVRDLVAYQDLGYARRYAQTVARVHQREQAVCPGQTGLTEAVARYLYKLMAYKDEYEVARLAVSAGASAAVADEFGPGTRVSYRLHPPVLRALGVKRKLSLGPWFRPAFAVLHSTRRLRGTALDPFGHTEVRRTERALVGEYLESVNLILDALSGGTHERCVELASLPDQIRGYEQIKMNAVARYRESQAELGESLARTTAAAS